MIETRVLKGNGEYIVQWKDDEISWMSKFSFKVGLQHQGGMTDYQAKLEAINVAKELKQSDEGLVVVWHSALQGNE